MAVFDPLAPALQGHTRLFLVPDGDLTRLPFEVLPLDQGRRLIERIASVISAPGVTSCALRCLPPSPPRRLWCSLTRILISVAHRP